MPHGMMSELSGRPMTPVTNLPIPMRQPPPSLDGASGSTAGPPPPPPQATPAPPSQGPSLVAPPQSSTSGAVQRNTNSFAKVIYNHSMYICSVCL